jgi:ubiquinone/menaquinone biosynthesis C-methylase UbiE
MYNSSKLLKEYTALAPSYDQATVLEGEAAQLPFDDAEFQLLTCTNALHHFPDVGASLRENRLVLGSDDRPRGSGMKSFSSYQVETRHRISYRRFRFG